MLPAPHLYQGVWRLTSGCKGAELKHCGGEGVYPVSEHECVSWCDVAQAEVAAAFLPCRLGGGYYRSSKERGGRKIIEGEGKG